MRERVYPYDDSAHVGACDVHHHHHHHLLTLLSCPLWFDQVAAAARARDVSDVELQNMQTQLAQALFDARKAEQQVGVCVCVRVFRSVSVLRCMYSFVCGCVCVIVAVSASSTHVMLLCVIIIIIIMLS